MNSIPSFHSQPVDCGQSGEVGILYLHELGMAIGKGMGQLVDTGRDKMLRCSTVGRLDTSIVPFEPAVVLDTLISPLVQFSCQSDRDQMPNEET